MWVIRDPVDPFPVALDLVCRHAPGVHRDDLIVEAARARLPTCRKDRGPDEMEIAVPIFRRMLASHERSLVGAATFYELTGVLVWRIEDL